MKLLDQKYFFFRKNIRIKEESAISHALYSLYLWQKCFEIITMYVGGQPPSRASRQKCLKYNKISLHIYFHRSVNIQIILVYIQAFKEHPVISNIMNNSYFLKGQKIIFLYKEICITIPLISLKSLISKMCDLPLIFIYNADIFFLSTNNKLIIKTNLTKKSFF